MTTRAPNGTSVADRIQMHSVVTHEGCRIWTAGKSRAGYGLIKTKVRGRRQTQYVHRLAYEIHVGPIPQGLQIDHLCRNRACCNPDHLEAVTQRENLLRGETLTAKYAAKTHCPQGHPYDEANTYIQPTSGGRLCRTCRRRGCREYQARKRAAA